MTQLLIPENFETPELLKQTNFLARKLKASDVYLDYIAVMSSIELIQKTRGGSRPTKVLSFLVTEVEYNKGLYSVLYQATKDWLESSWPFEYIHWSNKEIPEL